MNPGNCLRNRFWPGAFRALLTDPAHRTVFDYVTDAVRASHDIACIIRSDPDGMVYIALSQGFQAHPLCQDIEEGHRVRSERSSDSAAMLKALADNGIFRGDVEAVDALWMAQVDGNTHYWRAITCPVRANDGHWYLHVSMMPMNEDAYKALLEARGTPVTITRST